MRPYVENIEVKKPILKENLKDNLDKFLLGWLIFIFFLSKKMSFIKITHIY
jgi:hypothetical protein